MIHFSGVKRYRTFVNIWLFILIHSMACWVANAQLAVNARFRAPLEIPLYLSGNFAELRKNHFHTGLDIKTEQREGLRVLAADQGYVSRIKVSPVGYGYSLYLDHPSGYTTVYAHLQSYSKVIDDWVKRKQYSLKSFSIDETLLPNEIPVAVGDFIGLSGNSGGSGGPHLHFEIRETQTERPVNPLLFEFDIKDKIPPSVHSVWVIPTADNARVSGKQIPLSFELASAGSHLTVKQKSPIVVSGEIGLGVNAIDRLDGHDNRCGVYRIELFANGKMIYSQRMDSLSFTNNRAMNAHTIYPKFRATKTSIHRCYRLPGNPLGIYDSLINNGRIIVPEGVKIPIEYKIFDISGNETIVRFELLGGSPGAPVSSKPNDTVTEWNWDQNNHFTNHDIRLNIPRGCLYENLYLTLRKSNKVASAIGPTICVASEDVPAHMKYDISLPLGKVKNEHIKKALIVRYDSDKNDLIAEGGVVESGWIKTQTNYFGYFAVMVDTIKPIIQSITFKKNMSGQNSFSFRISDELSGIDQIIPEIDGQWALMEYDAKSNKITYYFDKRYIQKAQHSFKLRVLDARGNESIYQSDFVW
jgi:hypothetical protein